MRQYELCDPVRFAKRYVALPFAVALSAVSLVACGSDGAGSSDGTGASGSAAIGGSAAVGSGGGGGNGAASFREPRGDNSIPDFGQEASAAERERAASALVVFLRDRADGDWSGACTELSRAMRDQLAIFAKTSKGRSRSCGAVLRGPAGAAGTARVEMPAGGVAALRVKGRSAFALFYGAGNRKYVMPMTEEGGVWRMSQIAPLPYPLRAVGTEP